MNKEDRKKELNELLIRLLKGSSEFKRVKPQIAYLALDNEYLIPEIIDFFIIYPNNLIKHVLAEIGVKAIPYITDVINENFYELFCGEFVWILGRMEVEDESVIDLMIKVFVENRNSYSRRESIQGFSFLKQKASKVIPHFINILQNEEEDDELKANLIKALPKISTKDAIELLNQILDNNDESENIKRKAKYALGNIRH